MTSLATFLTVVATCAVDAAALAPSDIHHVTALRVATEPEAVRVTLVGDGPLVASEVAVADSLPHRIVVDLRDVDVVPGARLNLAVGGPTVSRVRVALHSGDPLVTRLVLDLTRAATFRVERDGADLRRLHVIVDERRRGAGTTAAEADLEPQQAAALDRATAAPVVVAAGTGGESGVEAPAIASVAPPGAAVGTADPPPDVPTAAPRAAATGLAPGPLARGLQVKVEGHARADGHFDAVEIVVRDVEDAVKAEGRVTAVESDHRTFSLLGFTVVVPDRAILYRGSRPGASRAEIAAGTWLEVKGTTRHGTVVATRIRIKDAPEATEELEATIDRIDADGLVVLGRRVRLGPTVRVVDQRTAVAGAATRLRRDDDEQSREPLRLGSRTIVGGRAESGWLEEGNYDLDDAGGRRDRWVSRLQGLASVQVTPSIEAYAKVAMNSRAVLAGGGPGSEREVEVQEAYLLAHRLMGSPISLQVGRQRFRDGREWFFDEYLDAVRVTVARGGWSVEGALAEGVFAGPVAARGRKDRRHQLLSVMRTHAGIKVSGFFIRRDDRGPGDDDPWWLGGLAEVKSRGGDRLWALASARRGHRGATALGGWAMDAGGSLVLDDIAGRPTLTAGFARASGDTVSGDGRDTAFRQTDLEDNSARLGGLRRVSYYGELLDPELSNLQVLTAGLGVRPTRTLGIDVVWHGYVQSVLRDSIPSSAFDVDATGTSGRLGQELDAAATLRVGRFDIDLAAGVFVTGPGLAAARRLAYFWRPQVRLYF